MTPPAKPAKKKKMIRTKRKRRFRLEKEWNFHTDFQKLEQAGDIYAPVQVVESE